MAMAEITPYLARYNAGEYEQVWAELGALGAAVRAEPVYSDALAVARETMWRVRENLTALRTPRGHVYRLSARESALGRLSRLGADGGASGGRHRHVD